jgi:beta-ribofuranosylaminobenzene 5'-phosphate synthase
MVERPGLELSVAKASEWSADGPLADRALVVGRSIAARLEAVERPIGAYRITIRSAPEQHVGLGTGTQLSMGLARALAWFAGIESPTVEALARLSERRRRSGIGIHGFEHGGLVVDVGRSEKVDVPTHLIHLPWPEGWSVLLVLPDSRPSVHGLGEAEAFAQLNGMAGERTDRLCRLVLLGLLPAVIESDLPAFGSALEEIQEVVGSHFAEVQHGRFTSPRAEEIVQSLRKLGLRGVGQSSWGPCLYGFTDRSSEERDQIRRTIREEFELTDDAVLWTVANRSGAKFTVV